MVFAYQISFSAAEVYNMAKQSNERIKETVSYYVNHFYKLILAKILIGEFTAPLINFNKFDEEKADKYLKEGTIVRVSRNTNDKKCLGSFSDFRNGIVTQVLEYKEDKRYLIKVIGEKACAPSDMPTNVYDSEKTYLRALFPGSKKQIFMYGNGFPIVNGEKLHTLSSMLYSADEIEVGSFEERYQIISQTMDELESLLGITIIKKVGANIAYPKKYTDYMYKISWKSEEELKQDLEKEEQEKEHKPYCFTSEEEEQEKVYAELYDLQQLSSTPEKEMRRLGLFVPDKEEEVKQEEVKEEEQKPSSTKLADVLSYIRSFKEKVEDAKNEEKPKVNDFPTVKLADIMSSYDNGTAVLGEKNDDAFEDNTPKFITIITGAN